MSGISNTGPLVALAKVDLLPVLRALFGEVRIPPAVHRELLAKVGPESERLDAALGDFVRVEAHRPNLEPVRDAVRHLGRGEQEAIALAHDAGTVLVIDERLGREAAHSLGVRVTGVVGVLLRAKAEGLVPSVRDVLEAMRLSGYWLSDALLMHAARLAGEEPAP